MTIAIVGFGKMGRFYDQLIQAKYVVDILPIQDRCYFATVDEFVAYGQPVDLVIVSSLTSSHFSITYQLLAGGYNVLCEKPICLTAAEAKKLEIIAKKKQLILYQSTLERFNPLIKFIKKNVATSEVRKVTSHRWGIQPHFSTAKDALFDLGIHDLDLWFHLFNRKVTWELQAKYDSQPRREIRIWLKNDREILLDLLNKRLVFNNEVIDFNASSQSNPMLEMLHTIHFKGHKINESWSSEIAILEKNSTKNKILLEPDVL